MFKNRIFCLLRIIFILVIFIVPGESKAPDDTPSAQQKKDWWETIKAWIPESIKDFCSEHAPEPIKNHPKRTVAGASAAMLALLAYLGFKNKDKNKEEEETEEAEEQEPTSDDQVKDQASNNKQEPVKNSVDNIVSVPFTQRFSELSNNPKASCYAGIIAGGFLGSVVGAHRNALADNFTFNALAGAVSATDPINKVPALLKQAADANNNLNLFACLTRVLDKNQNINGLALYLENLEKITNITIANTPESQSVQSIWRQVIALIPLKDNKERIKDNKKRIIDYFPTKLTRIRRTIRRITQTTLSEIGIGPYLDAAMFCINQSITESSPLAVIQKSMLILNHDESAFDTCRPRAIIGFYMGQILGAMFGAKALPEGLFSPTQIKEGVVSRDLCITLAQHFANK